MSDIRCVLFDFGGTVYSGRYFLKSPAGCVNWSEVFDKYVFGNPLVLSQWLIGNKSTADVAAIVAEHLDMSTDEVIKQMRAGCKDLRFNATVMDFASQLQKRKVLTGLVAISMDIFSDVIVPSHGLNKQFDTIVNSAGAGNLNKEVLWQKAFEQLDGDVDYKNSLLLEDNAANLELFGRRGGKACAYKDEASFRRWLDELEW